MYQIFISGASRGRSVEEGKNLAILMGHTLAKAGHSLLTGATIGLPNYAAEAYKKAGGKMSVGLSPAASKVEHVHKYRLPTEPYDTILYTGLHYIGRDALLITSADAVISIGGRLGTLHECTIAMETDTPIGFLEGSGGISTEIRNIIDAAGEGKTKNVIFSNDPDTLLTNIIKRLNDENKKYRGLYN